MGEVLEKLGERRVGFEPSALTVANFETLKAKAPTVEWVGLPGRVEALRAVKDRGEVEAIREAIDQAERAFAMLRAGLDAGGFGEGRGRRPGGLPPAVRGLGRGVRRRSSRSARGPPCPTPGRPGRGRVGDADFVLVDWGARRRGATKVT